VSLTIFYGLLTLAPLALGVALAALGLARRATPAVGVALAALGVIAPLAGLAWMAAEVSAGYPLEIALWGGATSWLAIYARADALSVFTGLGIAGLVTPLLLWVAWRAAPPDTDDTDAETLAITAAGEDDPDALEGAGDNEDEDEVSAREDEREDEAEPTAAVDETAGRSVQGGRRMGRWQWTGVALTLGLESFLLSLVFAENIAWLAVAWLLVIGASWALGELGSDPQALDWKGLALMAVGPVVWLVTTLLIAGPAGDRRLLDLMGETRFPMGHLFVMTLAIAVAAGAWPALGWMRKRAHITAPAGMGAAALVVMPAALFVGARTFGVAQTLSSAWPAFSLAQPPITIGVLPAVLGAVTVLFAGLLAMVRRDGRGLLASCALAVAGWGLLGLGVGAPLAALGVTLLLVTSTLGLGAMLASLVATGAVTADLEPDSAGPRVFGEPARPLALFAWIVGAATIAGLPLFAGFTPLQIISAAALPGPRIVIPLVGLAWGGAALLLIGLLRATVPAFAADPAEFPAMYERGVGAADTDLADTADTADDASDAETGDGVEKLAPPLSAPDLRGDDLPGVALGTLALIVGLAPSALLLIGSVPAAESFLQADALAGQTQALASGYLAGPGQWLATPSAIMVALVAVALAVIRWRLPRMARPAPVYLGGQTREEGLDGAVAELAGMPEPGDAWDDLRAVGRASWLTPGAGWLGVDASDEEAAEAPAEESEAEEGEAGEEVPTLEGEDETGAEPSAMEAPAEAEEIEETAEAEAEAEEAVTSPGGASEAGGTAEPEQPEAAVEAAEETVEAPVEPPAATETAAPAEPPVEAEPEAAESTETAAPAASVEPPVEAAETTEAPAEALAEEPEAPATPVEANGAATRKQRSRGGRKTRGAKRGGR
jgi:formate hydrogenlyase subunit 3/multisubunit Na+/H+ antiporter MnhD subunit